MRIPTKNGYHDGTMLFATTKDIHTRTVVIYHGNAEHRDNKYDLALEYQKRGYNVLLASYAGDPIIEGNETSYKEVCPICSELAMREDAMADYSFLKALQVSNVATHGYSLGGAQAMNFAQAVGKDTDTNINMDFVYLDHAFTNLPDTMRNVVRNAQGRGILERLTYNFAKKFIADETKISDRAVCTGLDNVEKLKEVATNSHFLKTKFCFAGASEDPLMGTPSREDKHNFSLDLYDAVSSLDESRLHEELQYGDHCSQFNYENSLKFLTE